MVAFRIDRLVFMLVLDKVTKSHGMTQFPSHITSETITPSKIPTSRPSSIPSQVVSVFQIMFEVCINKRYYFKFHLLCGWFTYVFHSYGQNMFPEMILSFKPSLLSSSPSNVGISWSSTSLSYGRSLIPSLNQSFEKKTPSRIPTDRPSSLPPNDGIPLSSSSLSNSRSSIPSLNESKSGIPFETITPSKIPTGTPSSIPSETVSLFQ